MQIRYGFSLSFDVPQPTAVLARLDVHPDRRSDIIFETPLLFRDEPAATPIVDTHGNLCRRLVAPPGKSTLEISGIIGDPSRSVQLLIFLTMRWSTCSQAATARRTVLAA